MSSQDPDLQTLRRQYWNSRVDGVREIVRRCCTWRSARVAGSSARNGDLRRGCYDAPHFGTTDHSGLPKSPSRSRDSDTAEVGELPYSRAMRSSWVDICPCTRAAWAECQPNQMSPTKDQVLRIVPELSDLSDGKLFKDMVDAEGIEPSTCRLRVECSAS